MADAFLKKVAETYPIDIDFTNAQPLGTTSITAASFSALAYQPMFPNVRSVDESVLASTTGTAPTAVKGRATVQAGLPGWYYDIVCRATWNDGSISMGQVTMRVEGAGND
jgi:hypothetical protein